MIFYEVIDTNKPFQLGIVSKDGFRAFFCFQDAAEIVLELIQIYL